MSAQTSQRFPKLHNAMWPGLVGKGSPGAEPCIDLDTMLALTAQAEVEGVKFDGVDLFLFDPHVSIEIDDDGLKRLADKIQSYGFVAGSVVAPVWAPTGGGAAMGTEAERQRFVEQVRKACRIAKRLRELGARPYGVVRIDSACGVADWTAAPEASQAAIARTFTEACQVAEDFGERLAAEGEICWGGMHSWRKMLDLLERVGRPRTLGFQADMAHTLLYTMGFNAAEDALLPQDWDWSQPARLDEALQTLTGALRPWTIDFHVAQNDATVKGSGTHDKTGHHCQPKDPNGKLNIARHAGFWLRDETGALTKAFQHICWDGCMFPNAVMMEPQTWNDILRAMISVRNAHGWTEPPAPTSARTASTELRGSTRATRGRRPTKSSRRPAKQKTSARAHKPRSVKSPARPPKKSGLKRGKKVLRSKPRQGKAQVPRKSAQPAKRIKGRASSSKARAKRR